MNIIQKTITPDVAKEMLSHNCKNRRIRALTVSKYADDMKNGKWTETPDAICFDANGTLLNGQHRLNAVIQANIPVVMTIAYGVQADAVIDKGISRDTSDSLYMRGLISRKAARRDFIAVAKRYIEIAHGKIYTDSRVCDFLNENELLIEKAISASSTGAHSRANCKRGPVQTAVFSALKCGADINDLVQFCTVANSGFMMNELQSAAIVLRNYLNDIRSYSGGMSNEICAFSQLAIRDFIAGVPRRQRYKKLKHIYIRRDRQ